MPGQLDRLEKICSKNPTSILFARLADAYLSRGDVKRASEVCRRGLRYRPSYVTGHVVMGKCHLAAGRLEEARQEFHKVLQLDPDHVAAFWHLGRVHLEMGWKDLALDNFRQAHSLDPFNRELAGRIEALETLPPATRDGGDAGRSASADVDGLDLAPSAAYTFPTDVDGPETTPETLDLASLAREIQEEGDLSPAGPGARSPGENAGIATFTLAEIYASQGLVERAVGLLEQVLVREPGHQEARRRLEELRRESDEIG
jgi:tetratricopeptide (TPR) repeat protein